VRWDSQTVTEEAAGRLPGYADTIVRRFDAPEALDIRFHEVQTKSALNRVPAAARLPFRWTINPYRGCTHACTYCASGETPILMADGRTRELEDLRVGDAIYGTVRMGRYHRYVVTEVLAHWSTVKPAFRVTLEDGTELIASGDHRFLTRRGWRHVTGSSRPHLTLGSRLMGVGHFAGAPASSADYRRGYLCGLILGDDHIVSHAYDRPGRTSSEVHRIRPALADREALLRGRRYLEELGVGTTEFAFQAAAGRSRAIQAIGTSSRAGVDRVREIVAWPWCPSEGWSKGFLAGIFDAEGSFGEVVRIANTDTALVERTAALLAGLRFDAVIEDHGRANGLRCVRIRGGLHEQLRFFHTVDPAITRKRSIAGRAVKSAARLGVVAVEPLGVDFPLYDITTGTGDFIADGVVSHNCFARPTHEYLDLDAGRDFEREIVVKVNVPEVLRAELARPSWKRETVALGTNTDPYQWVEGRYKLMRGIWEAMRDFANPCSILTKSPLVLRDADLLREIAAVADVSACLSVPTLEERAWRATEPHTPHPRARLEAVAELNRRGIPTGILIAPLMPGINDAAEQVEEIVRAATEAGAVHIAGNTLFLRGSVREIFFAWLRAHRPDLVERYERLYARGAHIPPAERKAIERAAAAPWARRSYSERFRHRAPPGDAPSAPPPAREPPVQTTLF
jgi:DNA repair photolyase